MSTLSPTVKYRCKRIMNWKISWAVSLWTQLTRTKYLKTLSKIWKLHENSLSHTHTFRSRRPPLEMNGPIVLIATFLIWAESRQTDLESSKTIIFSHCFISHASLKCILVCAAGFVFLVYINIKFPFHAVANTDPNGTEESVHISEVSLFQECP